MTAGRPTIHDVARRAGVSKSLVSLALRGSPRVSDASRTAILAAVAELGYRPNAAARSLADRRSRTIGVLVLDLHNPVFAEILDGIQTQVRGHGYSTMLVSGDAEPERELAELEKLLEFQVEGLVLVSHRLSPTNLRRFASEVPAVVVSRDDVHGPHIDTVSNDDVAGATLAVQHLIGLGHERITHLSGGDNPAASAREQGYRSTMKAAGLTRAIRVVPGGLTDTAGYSAALTALAHRSAPTALFVANDIAALGAIAAAQDSGRAVPRDISVVGYDGIALGALPTLSLTTVAQPLAHMGALAGQRLFERIANPTERAHHLRVESSLLVRGSTARPPRR